MLDEKNPHIRNIRDGTAIMLDVNNGLYTMDMWICLHLTFFRRGLKGPDRDHLRKFQITLVSWSLARPAFAHSAIAPSNAHPMSSPRSGPSILSLQLGLFPPWLFCIGHICMQRCQDVPSNSNPQESSKPPSPILCLFPQSEGLRPPLTLRANRPFTGTMIRNDIVVLAHLYTVQKRSSRCHYEVYLYSSSPSSRSNSVLCEVRLPFFASIQVATVRSIVVTA